MLMDYKRLIIRGISYSQTQTGAYVLLLEEINSGTKLPIIIGSFEAQSISMGLEKDLHPPRPITHDLFTSFIKTIHYTLESVVIYKFADGVFFSNINFTHKTIGDYITLDARTSDAVAMAIRFNAPIYATEGVIKETGIFLSEENEDWEEEMEIHTTESKTIKELQKELDEAVKNEDFDLALKIQEKINNRKLD